MKGQKDERRTTGECCHGRVSMVEHVAYNCDSDYYYRYRIFGKHDQAYAIPDRSPKRTHRKPYAKGFIGNKEIKLKRLSLLYFSSERNENGKEVFGRDYD